ncbi:SusC/RagA family TonB-linked outer membrane protein [Chitinophagaceae bacterium LB-8]|uniref:SusC/RagA family TonB-linked outer membrane protein n=1 Tax=Paraflavisolibacter caeni TaxID=2982496 RepID=A0A9X3B7L9_9BACT|nr:SusC/RagA family TonB-linked outer membrane protein [Paraflavisolibacter caeni]MCU7549425.1 SusC/RagA family TonB-linked outer membrane protein [Paraflavisolibacter caeni]
MKIKSCLFLLLLFSFTAAFAQNRSITGRVTSSKGNTMPGVTVTQKGSQNSVVTDEEGKYSIIVPSTENLLLVFSSVGSKTQEIALGTKKVIDVVLTEGVSTLGEVVVVGYGSQSRKNLSSSISTVRPDDFNRGAITDVRQLMQGKVAGLNITASGNPNAPAAVVLRGASTLNSSQSPLYVIDGIPGADISAIAPDDITSIDVLKDAAATAIYGNRAANGVIMVTTKKGRRGQFSIGYSGYVGHEKVANRLEMMDADELRSLLTKNGQAFAPADDKGANTDWQKEVERSFAISHNHNLSISGGTEHGNYSASINYAEKEGIMRFSDLKRLIARLSIEQSALKDKIRFGMMVTNSNSNANNVPLLNTVLTQMIRYLPVSPVRNADGTYFENFATVNSYNPVAMIEQAQDNTKSNSLIGSFTTHVKLPFDLTYDLNASYQNYTNLHGEYYNSYYSKYSAIRNFGTNGLALRNAYQNTNKILESYLTWNKKYGIHSINAVLGYSWQGNVIGEGFQTTSTNFPTDNIGYNNLSLSNPYAIAPFRVDFGADGIYQETRLISDFLRLNYNLSDKYLLQLSVRRDGSSVFGANNQWGYFPSAGLAWRIIQEGFMNHQKFFTDLKLRASYGVTGNSTGFNAYTAQIMSGSLGTFYNNGTQMAAYGPIQADNPNLEWEKTATANIGLDFTILNGKISGTLEAYNKNTTGMIYGYTVNPVLIPTGRITANGGSMNNRGIELSLNASPVRTSKFNWNTSLNLAHNRNEITGLTNQLFAGGDSVRITGPNGQGQTGSTIQILKSGKPVGQFFTLEYAGKTADGISQYYDPSRKLTTTPRIGVDYGYLGSPQPKLLLGWTNTFQYGNFDLNVFLRGCLGNKIFNATRADLFRPSTAQYSNILKDAANEPINDVNVYKYSTRFIEDGSYVRLDNATLAYSFKKLGDNIRMLKVYTTVNNFFVITKYKGIDPEISQGGLAPGYDNNNFYPRTRTILLGLNVSF